MLPKNLSVDYLSLVHGKERLSITTTMVFNNYGKLVRSYIDKTKLIAILIQHTKVFMNYLMK